MPNKNQLFNQMKKLLIGAIALSACLASQAADNTPLWLRNVALSPDGSTIAFTYKGDVYTVPVAGGAARQITSNPAYDSYPVWSPDGKQIAFSSDRDGSHDVFVINAKGGTAKRLTTSSASERPAAWLNDSTVLFIANEMPDHRAAQGPFGAQVYSVTTSGKRPKMFSTQPMAAISVNGKGNVLYQDKKGYENAYRKHETSSSTGDIRLMKDGKNTCLTTFKGNDQNPVWLNDDNFAYLSEEDGTLNVYSRNLSGSDKRKLTSFTKHPVRSLSAAKNGTLAFSWNGEIYTVVPGKEPSKVNVSIVSDDYDRDLIDRCNSGASTLAVSPTGKEVAFVMRGEVYVTSVKYKTTKRITNTPGQERNVSFSKDGRTLVYDSERDGKWQLFTTKIKNDNEKQFAYATELVEEPLYSSDKASQQPVFSPDGKKVAFLEDRTILKVIDVDSKKAVTALDGKYNYSYTDGDVNFTWSPDSRNLLINYIGVGGWNNMDIAMVAADGSRVIDLTESGYTDTNPRWALGGEAITWQSDRFGMRSHGSWGAQDDIMFMALTPEAYDKLHLTDEEAALAKEEKDEKEKAEANAKDSKKDKKKGNKDKKDSKEDAEKAPINYDFDNRALRIERLTSRSGGFGDYVLSTEGDKLYYIVSDATGSTNLMEMNLRKGDTKVLVRGVNGNIVPDEKIENLYVLPYNGGLKKVDLAKGDAEAIEFDAPYDRAPSKEREYIYDHMLSQVRDKFYDENLHGVDWDGYAENYRRFLPYINNNEDFAILLSEILGELNASHTGGRYSGNGNYSTASLGAYFDDEYNGEGLKVVEIIPGGPLATSKSGVKPGEVILSIDGTTLTPGMDYNPLLKNKAGKKVLLEVMASNGVKRNVNVRPISKGKLSDLLYRRWVRRNQAMVDSLSNGRIAYVHIEGMDSPSFRTVYSELLGKYRNREAVIVDTRWNGGGWLHNDVAILLSGKKYVDFKPRGRYIGSEPFAQWTKPSVMLVNEANYSDAHGTPVTYQNLGIGKVVGAPIPGTMTAVWWETQIDPSLVFGIPQVTSVDAKGTVMENHQLQPDVEVYNDPMNIEQGIDEQIAKSVEELLKQLDAAK